MRFERLVVYAQCQHHRSAGALPSSVRYAGSRRAFARLRTSAYLDLERPLLMNGDLFGGLWSTYRQPAVRLGLLKAGTNRGDVASTTLTSLGRDMALRAPIINAALARKWARSSQRIYLPEPIEVAVAIGKDSGGATRKEATALGRAFSAYDERRAANGQGRPFRALRTAYDDAGSIDLALDTLESSLLTEGQSQALADARALEELMRLIEKPYRRWVTGHGTTLPRKLATSRSWNRVRALGEPELVELHQELQRDSSMDAVNRHQERLAARRGHDPWVAGDPRPGRDEMLPLSFSLGAVSRLFDEGVAARHGG